MFILKAKTIRGDFSLYMFKQKLRGERVSGWVDVIDENALADGENIVIDVDGTDVAVFKIEGGFYAIEDVCSHDGAEIASGELEGDEIICPRHGARFCVKTGAVKSPPAYENIDCFPVRIENGKVQVRDNRFE
jgi:3-phenylpropionate/trans-cinnamate dioxygenase ferredoxin subunit